jgi:Meiotically up-regulated gene 113
VKARVTHQRVTPDFPTEKEFVYVLQFGKRFVKIGRSTNVKQRVADLQATTMDNLLMLAVYPGGRALEKRLHKLFADFRVRNEFFHFDYVIWNFLEMAKQSPVNAVEYVERMNAWRRKPRSERMRILRKQRRKEHEAQTVPIYPKDWNDARLEANREPTANRRQHDECQENANTGDVI